MNGSMALSLPFGFLDRASRASSSRPALRLVLVKDEVLSLPRAASTLRVLSGRAWLSVDSRDLVVEAGESLKLSKSRHPALVASTGEQSLFFEFE